MQLKIGDVVRIKTLTEIVLTSPVDIIHGVAAIGVKNNKFSIAPGNRLIINGYDYSYGMYEQGGRIGEIIAMLPDATEMVVDVAKAGEFNYCYHPNWLELQNRAGEVILSEEVMSLI